MAGGRAYDGSGMAVECISSEAFEALLASSSSTPQSHLHHVSRSMPNLEDALRSSPEHSFFRRTNVVDEVGSDELDDCFLQPEKKRRLTTDQVQFLEKSFEVENKLEPDRKIQLAKDLGLEPRQVAIWFQNRRARWKTKQLEKDYEALKANYEHLIDDHANLNKEKETLKIEVQILRDMFIQKQMGLENTSIRIPKIEEQSSTNHSHQKLQEPEEKNVVAPILTCIQEDICSANSIVFDPESPKCAVGPVVEPADSSNMLHELDNHHNTDKDEDDERMKTKLHGFLPDLLDNSCNFDFQVGEEDHAAVLWSW